MKEMPPDKVLNRSHDHANLAFSPSPVQEDGEGNVDQHFAAPRVMYWPPRARHRSVAVVDVPPLASGGLVVVESSRRF